MVKIWEDPEIYNCYGGDNQLKLIDEMILLCHEKLITHPEIFAWLQRMRVALRFAAFLKYLHSRKCSVYKPFTVRNLDTAHIVLDEDYNAKLCDFGLITGGTSLIAPKRQTTLRLNQILPKPSRVAFVIIGNFACKTVYELSRLISNVYFKSYPNLTRSQQVEWNNRAMSTFHALYITTASLYFAFWSDLYIDDILRGPITLRSSMLSSFALGVSVGYFLSDLGMIIWSYPSLGGMEYVIHHLLSLVAVGYAMLMGEAQHYTFLVLLSEETTPSINLRWYLDTAQMKRSRAYIVNGVVIFLIWLVARILWFLYLFFHAYRHRYQVMEMHKFGVALILIVPAVISVMNLMWF